MGKQKKTIARALMFGCIATILIPCLLVGAMGFTTYYRGMIAKYQTYIHDILEYVMTDIDGDDLEQCMETGEKSEAFERTQSMLNTIKESHDIEYIYIIKPLSTEPVDNMMDVMAGITAWEKETDLEFYSVTFNGLTGDDYSSEVAGLYLKAMEKNETSYFSNSTEFGYDYTGLRPILNSKGEPVAILAVDISANEISRVLWRFVLILALGIILLSLLTQWVVYRWLHKHVVDPLVRLKSTTESFVESSRTASTPDQLVFTDPDIQTGDEMESLSVAVSQMFADMKRYMTDLVSITAERERIGAELNVATQIQADMLPRIFPAFPKFKEFDLYASMSPAKEVGGDFYDFFLVDDDHLCLVMADVSGKGVPAALFMVIAKTLIKNRAQLGESPAEILKNVNNQLSEGNEAELFVTVWIAIIEISTGKGIAANAGHEHPVIRRGDGKYELVVYRHSPAVATIEGIRFQEHPFTLNPGDRLFVYTDGVAEATDAHNELFGTERMLDALNRDPDVSPEQLLINMRQSIDTFVGDAPQFDDITMLCLVYFGNKE